MVVVTYDIPDDRRRTRLHTALHEYCQPVQESVFECEVSEKHVRDMKRKVRRLIRPRTDRVRYYHLCALCSSRIEEGHGGKRPDEPHVFVV